MFQVGKDKLSVRYNGPAQHDNDVGSIQVGLVAVARTLLHKLPAAHQLPAALCAWL